MSFPTIRITESGKELISKVLSGEYTISFTKFAVGKGACGDRDEWDGKTQLIDFVMDVSINSFERVDDTVTLSGEFSNAVADNDFWWRELGIYAKIINVETGVEGADTLCFYANAEGFAEFVPGADSETAVTHSWNTTLTVSSDADVSAVVKTITYATIEQLERHKENKENPHEVTQEQVGLGNVPNVTTNNQTPTYNLPDARKELVSGEKMSEAFGKIAKFIKDGIAHLIDVNNPHKVTYSQAGAAPKSHRDSGTTYGMATSKYYGHVKLSDSISSTSGAADGVAASSLAVKNAIPESGSGYIKTPDGTMIQWVSGNVECPAESVKEHPITFPNSFKANPVVITSMTTSYPNKYSIQSKSPSKTGSTLTIYNSTKSKTTLYYEVAAFGRWK